MIPRPTVEKIIDAAHVEEVVSEFVTLKKRGTNLLGLCPFHGEKTPFVLSDLDPQLVKQVDYVFDGVCKGQQASTVINCTVTPWQIVRQGQIVL